MKTTNKTKVMIINLTMLMAGTMTVSAQLRVDSNGRIFTGGSTATMLDNDGLKAHASNTDKYYNSALHGCFTSDNTPTGSTIGVLGSADSNGGVKNYGVAGLAYTGTNGAGIFGSNDMLLTDVSGKYAGYFKGATKVDGTLTATTIVNISDIRLKKNICSLSGSTTQGSTLQNVLDMNVITYNLKVPRHYSGKEIESIAKEFSADEIEIIKKQEREMEAEKHFGLSAQELKEIYPELVREGQDGYLAVNYIELVPILIRSIQELKAELDEVKGGAGEKTRADATAVGIASANSDNVLYQNTPNPFKEKTVIRFSLADDAQDAAICIFDMSGKMLRKLPVKQGDTSISINGYELGEGMFLYTLLVNGQEIDTKRMIITK